MSNREVIEYVKKRATKNVAPGPDNIKVTVWRKVPASMINLLASCLTLCLRKGEFPDIWKKSNLVLIPKESSAGTSGAALPRARPICLLSEVNKTFERVIADRIVVWMEEHEFSNLSENQFGFRRRRSTMDALFRVRDITSAAVEAGGIVIAVGLDIRNAFNSISWGVILSVLVEKKFPPYLIRIIGAYLSHRSVSYVDNRNMARSRPITAGVPQGSVLGSLLWNIAFESVLRLRAENGCHTVCYADDTFVVATARRVFDAGLKISLQLCRVINHIGSLGLEIAENKTEVVVFHRGTMVAQPSIEVGRTFIKAKPHMKYLGVIIDSHWTFRPHLEYIQGKAAKVVRALGRLMPNLRGPSMKKRSLYAYVVSSVVLYASPLWADKYCSATYKIARLLRVLQRTTAIRVVSGYRTISYVAACLLAGMPSWPLEAARRRRAYERTRQLRDE